MKLRTLPLLLAAGCPATVSVTGGAGLTLPGP